MSRASRPPTLIDSDPNCHHSSIIPNSQTHPDTEGDIVDQIYVPPRAGTPFPRGPPPSSEDEADERARPLVPAVLPQRASDPSSAGSKGRLSGEATTTTIDSGVSVEYTFKDLGSAKKALKRIRTASRRAASSAMMDQHQHRPGTPRSVNARNAEGYERDRESLEEEESDDDRGRRERRRRDNAEVIRTPRGGVKRKEPAHRVLDARNLRPALRMAQTDTDDRLRRMPMERQSMPPQRSPYDQSRSASDFGRMPGATPFHKPLPSLPQPQHYGAMYPGFPYPQHQEGYPGTFSPIAPSFNGMSSPPLSPMMSPGQHAYAMDYYGTMNQAQGRDNSSIFSLRGLREALPFMPRRRGSVYDSEEGSRFSAPNERGYDNASMPNINELLPRPSYATRHSPDPADNLNLYLKKAVIGKWDKWVDPGEQESFVMERGRWQTRPLWGAGSTASNHIRGGFAAGSPKARTVDRLVSSAMGYTNPATGSPDRSLRQWMQRKSFFRAIEQSFEKNVPYRPISKDNRWGEQTFAVPAEGFHTLQWGDEAARRAADLGLLGWMTGTFLDTAASVLHMLRFNSQNMSFQVLSDTVAPSLRDQHGRSHFTRGGVRQENTTELPDGCGSFVLVDVQIPMDRAMIFCVRPPWLIGKQELQDFVQPSPEWMRDSLEALRSIDGQSNLLQASIFDDCVRNHCFFFCVTNLQYWVFGHFDPDFKKCSVSPVINRKADTPSIMQILSVWCLRSVDERPRDAEMGLNREISPLPRSPSVRTAHLPTSPILPTGAPPGYVHRDLPSVPERAPPPPMIRNDMRGQSLPPSRMEGSGIYPMLAPNSYGIPGYHTNMLPPPQPGLPQAYGYDMPGLRPGSSRSHYHDGPSIGRPPQYSEDRGERSEENERERARLRHERERAHARERRSSWLPRRE